MRMLRTGDSVGGLAVTTEGYIIPTVADYVSWAQNPRCNHVACRIKLAELGMLHRLPEGPLSGWPSPRAAVTS